VSVVPILGKESVLEVLSGIPDFPGVIVAKEEPADLLLSLLVGLDFTSTLVVVVVVVVMGEAGLGAAVGIGDAVGVVAAVVVLLDIFSPLLLLILLLLLLLLLLKLLLLTVTERGYRGERSEDGIAPFDFM